MTSHAFSHLRHLEAANIRIIRTVAAGFESPAMPSSGGTPSACLPRPAEQAFPPAGSPRAAGRPVARHEGRL